MDRTRPRRSGSRPTRPRSTPGSSRAEARWGRLGPPAFPRDVAPDALHPPARGGRRAGRSRTRPTTASASSSSRSSSRRARSSASASSWSGWGRADARTRGAAGARARAARRGVPAPRDVRLERRCARPRRAFARFGTTLEPRGGAARGRAARRSPIERDRLRCSTSSTTARRARRARAHRPRPAHPPPRLPTARTTRSSRRRSTSTTSSRLRIWFLALDRSPRLERRGRGSTASSSRRSATVTGDASRGVDAACTSSGFEDAIRRVL